MAMLTLGTSRADPSWAATKCFDDPVDATQIGDARTAIDAACKCFAFDGSKGKKYHDYKGCAHNVILGRVPSQLREECKATVTKFYAQSICGATGPIVDARGPVVTCVSVKPGNKVGCSRTPIFLCPPYQSLGASTVRHVCLASTKCIDAADTNGDLRIDSSDTGLCTAASTFTDNGDGTVTDNGTGLMWEKKSRDGSLHDETNAYTWSLSQAGNPDGTMFTTFLPGINAGSGFAGHTDWRIPTVLELLTLVRLENYPLVAAEFNTGCVPGCTVATCSCNSLNYADYWSSGTFERDHATAMDVYFGAVGPPPTLSGSPLLDVFRKYLYSKHVRAVRGGS